MQRQILRKIYPSILHAHHIRFKLISISGLLLYCMFWVVKWTLKTFSARARVHISSSTSNNMLDLQYWYCSCWRSCDYKPVKILYCGIFTMNHTYRMDLQISCICMICMLFAYMTHISICMISHIYSISHTHIQTLLLKNKLLRPFFYLSEHQSAQDHILMHFSNCVNSFNTFLCCLIASGSGYNMYVIHIKYVIVNFLCPL